MTRVVPGAASAPASSANLGPGFDCLAVALQLRIEVAIAPAKCFDVDAQGEGAGIPASARHLAARVLRDVLGHDEAKVSIRSEIPVARGLGSSAALAVATAAAAGASDPLAVACRIDGHPENAAASVHGGLVAATMLGDGEPLAVQFPLDGDAAFVVLVPDRSLSTKDARAVLPRQVTHAEAAGNVSRTGALIGALRDLSLLRPGLMDDRLHQPYRLPLMPEADALMTALVAAGALGAAWSGAGPSLIAVCRRDDADAVHRAGSAALAAAGVEGDARILGPDMRGLQVAEQ
ncbi:MAG TPA: homoserine kinase [Acidimicrobiales bacterium]|nr:homoserine kinase [Acidimicrobiales bacterium]